MVAQQCTRVHAQLWWHHGRTLQVPPLTTPHTRELTQHILGQIFCTVVALEHAWPPDQDLTARQTLCGVGVIPVRGMLGASRVWSSKRRRRHTPGPQGARFTQGRGAHLMHTPTQV